MGDLSNPKLMWLKGWLFLGIGTIASVLLLLQAPSWRVALLLAVIVWAFCRAYYFAFYVIEHYIDPEYRFAGLIAFARYVFKNRRSVPTEDSALTTPADEH